MIDDVALPCDKTQLFCQTILHFFTKSLCIQQSNLIQMNEGAVFFHAELLSECSLMQYLQVVAKMITQKPADIGTWYPILCNIQYIGREN